MSEGGTWISCMLAPSFSSSNHYFMPIAGLMVNYTQITNFYKLIYLKKSFTSTHGYIITKRIQWTIGTEGI